MPDSLRYIDIHAHNPGEEGEEYIRLYNLYLQDFGSGIHHSLFSCGLHPWHIDIFDNLEDLPSKLREVVRDKRLCALGETGLDKIVSVSMEKQEQVFREHILVSESYGFPLIIHCVKAYQQILKIRKETRAIQKWIIHGFNRSPQLAGDLSKAGLYLSVGPSLLSAGKEHCGKVIRSIPAERLFIESDEEETAISEIYAQVAFCLGISREELLKQVNTNFEEVFGEWLK